MSATDENKGVFTTFYGFVLAILNMQIEIAIKS